MVVFFDWSTDGYLRLILALLIVFLLFFLFMFAIFEIIIFMVEMEGKTKNKDVKDLIKKFYSDLDAVRTQSTNEILECLLDMEKLDETYNTISDKYMFLDDISYFKLKEDILENVIFNKINSISNDGDAYEWMKSILDEIEGAGKRFPEFNYVFSKYSYVLNEKINENH
ncbi:MAG: hypothetical protein IKF82_03925 [Bacilli bacterium]|nr:hypothetical protein [Bacilli bacterium]